MDLLGLAVPLSQWHLKWQMPPTTFRGQINAMQRRDFQAVQEKVAKLIHRWRLSLIIIFCKCVDEKEVAYSCQSDIGSWAGLLLQGVSLDLSLPSFAILSVPLSCGTSVHLKLL